MSRFDENTKSQVVLDVNRNDKGNIWKGNKLNAFYNPLEQWQKVIATFQIKEKLMPDDLIKIYVWNPKGETIWIDDLKVEIIETSPRKLGHL